ncbi:hypothetical protein QNO09_39005 [Streptomyces sp. 378]|uniref:hypothetical protein n=1 Tax=Streptomyces sp. 378 TaxID=3049412 RepID=UPI0024C2B666|nr:hypothetical protein [Streptomyces sp. 378]MDK1349133.1 hypothetical protein [Streptomyces sp. 378]
MAEEHESISQDEVAAFVRKLEQWSAGLDDKEKALLQAMLTPPEDIQQDRSTLEDRGFKFNKFSIEVPLESLLYRFRYEQEGPEQRVYIKDPGPSWVRFIQRQR